MSDAPELPALAALSSWQGVALPKLPTEITTAVEGIAALGNATVSVLQVVSGVLDVLAGVSIETDPTKALLNTAIRVLEDGLNTLLNDSGVYVLFVPVRRKILVSPLIQEAIALVGTPLIQEDLDPAALVVRARLAANNEQVGEFFRAPAEGGNAGFFRTVFDSILDEGDPNRPLFEQANYVAGIHVVAGASDYVNLLSFITALDGLMLPPGPANNTLSTPGLPVPQNLRGSSTRLADGGLGARLVWDAQVPVATIPTLNTACLITQLAVIRTTDPRQMSVATPEGLFGSKTLIAGMSAPGDPDTRVVAVLDYAVPLPPSTYDDDGLEDGKTYYYFTCFRFKMGNFDELTSGATYPDQGFYHLSNVAVVTAAPRSARSGRGVPPDWVRTPSVVDLLPVAGQLLELLLSTLRQFSAKTSGNADALRKYVSYLQAEIVRLQSLVSSMTGMVQRLTSLSAQTPSAGAYARVFAGKGGTDFMLADLAASLAPSNDDDQRPPFDRGDEFVTGVVVMVGAPSEDGVNTVKLMLETLFGIGGTGGTTPLQAAIAAIDAQLSAQEAASFGDDFTVGGAATVSQGLTGDIPLSDDDPGSCDDAPPPKPVFGDNFEVIP